MVLLACSLVFVYQNIQEDIHQYIDGSTGYSESTETISLTDLPTLTICLNILKVKEELAYGDDFLIKAKIQHWTTLKDTSKLQENEWVKVPFALTQNGNETAELELKIREMTKIQRLTPSQCYKISAQWKENHSINFQKFKVRLEFHGNLSVLKHAEFMFTSELNAYGIVGDRWFDGLIANAEKRIQDVLNQTHDFKIIGRTEYRNIRPCSDDSYYECLGKIFANPEFFKMRGSKNQCIFDDKQCTPFSLPNNENTPLCSLNVRKSCSAMFWALQESGTRQCKKKTCNTEEYNLVLRQRDFGTKEGAQFIVEYSFDPPRDTRDSRTTNPYKTIKKEHFTMSSMSLLGSVGGTLGMFVGFSFIGLSETLMNGLERLGNLKRKS